MNKDNIPVVRRQSGGGTVYHDYGNLNYTIISPKEKHDVKVNLELVCSVVNKIGFKLYPNERNDIVVDHEDFTIKFLVVRLERKRSCFSAWYTSYKCGYCKAI